MAASFFYRLVGVGWSECEFTVNEAHVTLSASYLSDALRHLLAAVNRLLSGGGQSTASFDEEPSEYRWLFKRVSDNVVRVQILWIDDNSERRPDAEGKPLFSAECGVRTLGVAVHTGCRELLNTTGAEEYARKWMEHSFPAEEFEKMQSLLRR